MSVDNRGGHGGRGGRGGGSGGASWKSKGGGPPIFTGRHDRYCCWCSQLIEQQNLLKTVKCPNPSCKRNVQYRSQLFNEHSGLGRCSNCDAMMHVSQNFCGMCGFRNEEAFRRRNEAEKLKAEKALKQKEEENDELVRKVVELKRKVEEFEKEREEKRRKEETAEDILLSGIGDLDNEKEDPKTKEDSIDD